MSKKASKEAEAKKNLHVQNITKTYLINIQPVKKDAGNSSAAIDLPDKQSFCGRFGWLSLGDNYLPYVLRRGDKYCAVRMVEKQVFAPYLAGINPTIFKNCVDIPSYFITVSEQRLLNEINSFHCDFLFGKATFSARDLVIRVDDVVDFYHFLITCYTKLLNLASTSHKYGFIVIDKKSIVPFVIKDDEKYLPLFYFDGVEHLKLASLELRGWDLAYLKFCYTVQGIREEYLKLEMCACVPLKVIAQYFPPQTIFQEWWPKSTQLQRFIGNKTAGAPNNYSTWFLFPSANSSVALL